MGSNPSATNTRAGRIKGYHWLIVTLVLGAFALIGLIGFIAFLSHGYTPRYSPANFEVELKENRTNWDSAHITHYKMVVDYSGYAPYPQMPWTLEVQNDEVVSAINAQGNPVAEAADNSHHSARFFMITALFLHVEQTFQRRPVQLWVSYNPTYSYPEDISINLYREPCCQGYQIEIRDFQVLP